LGRKTMTVQGLGAEPLRRAAGNSLPQVAGTLRVPSATARGACLLRFSVARLKDFQFVAGSKMESPVLATTSRAQVVAISPFREVLGLRHSGSIAPATKMDFGTHVPYRGTQTIALDVHPDRPLVATNRGFQVSVYDVDRDKRLGSLSEQR